MVKEKEYENDIGSYILSFWTNETEKQINKDTTAYKVSLALIGIKKSPEHIEAARQAKIGKTHSLKTKERIRKSKLNHKQSDETKDKRSKSLINRKISKDELLNRLGRKHTDETKKKMSDTAKNRTVSDKTKLLMSISHLGHKHSEDTKQKISKNSKGKIISEESRKRMSESSSTKKRVSIDGIIFDSRASAAKFHNVTPATISNRINNNSVEQFKDWFYIKD